MRASQESIAVAVRSQAVRPADVRARILEEATRLFAAQGFDSTPLQQISDAVGVRKPSLLYHFPSKDALRQSVLDELLTRWNDVLPRLFMAATAGDEIFDAVVREAVGFFTADPNRARLLVRELLDHPLEMKAQLLAQLRPWIEVISRYLRKGQALGIVHEALDPEAYIVVVTNLLVSAIASAEILGPLLASEGAPGGATERLVPELVRLAREGLFGTKSTPNAARPNRPSTPNPRARPATAPRARTKSARARARR